MVFADPLGHLSFPWFNREVVAFSLKFGYRALPFHFHEIIMAFSIYNTIFSLSRLLSPWLVSSYKSMTRRNQLNFDVHVVSTVQSIAILLLLCPMMYDEKLSQDRVNGYTPYGGFVIAMAEGYFVWDTYICLRHYKLFGFGFLVHGLGSLFVFMQGFRPFGMYYAPIFLLFELSTPFVNFHWFAGHLPAGTVPEWAQKLNGLILLITFPSVRILWGFFQAYQLGKDVFPLDIHGLHPWWVSGGCLLSNFALDTLNIYWYYKMIKAVRRRLRQAREPLDPLVEKKKKAESMKKTE